MAAVVTQLFSYMVTQGTWYGYICTGQAYAFLRIGDDPSNVYYSVHIPSRDFDDNDHWRLHQTLEELAEVYQGLRSWYSEGLLWSDPIRKV